MNKFKYFLKIDRMFNLSDLWGLPWYLGLSVEKKFRYLASCLQVCVTSFYLSEYLPLAEIRPVQFCCKCTIW